MSDYSNSCHKLCNWLVCNKHHIENHVEDDVPYLCKFIYDIFGWWITYDQERILGLNTDTICFDWTLIPKKNIDSFNIDYENRRITILHKFKIDITKLTIFIIKHINKQHEIKYYAPGSGKYYLKAMNEFNNLIDSDTYQRREVHDSIQSSHSEIYFP